MGLGDLGSIVIIIFIFALIHLFLSLSIGITKIKNNWDTYKCNPGIIPFASVFGHDTMSNLNECIKLQQSDYMQSFMGPINESLNSFAKNGAVFTQMFEKTKGLGVQNHNSISDLTGNINDRVKTILEESQMMYGSIVDTFSKMGATITIVFYSIQTLVDTADSMWMELPGTIMRLAKNA